MLHSFSQIKTSLAYITYRSSNSVIKKTVHNYVPITEDCLPYRLDYTLLCKSVNNKQKNGQLQKLVRVGRIVQI